LISLAELMRGWEDMNLEAKKEDLASKLLQRRRV
jgi:hypothetical protein